MRRQFFIIFASLQSVNWSSYTQSFLQKLRNARLPSRTLTNTVDVLLSDGTPLPHSEICHFPARNSFLPQSTRVYLKISCLQTFPSTDRHLLQAYRIIEICMSKCMWVYVVCVIEEKKKWQPRVFTSCVTSVCITVNIVEFLACSCTYLSFSYTNSPYFEVLRIYGLVMRRFF